MPIRSIMAGALLVLSFAASVIAQPAPRDDLWTPPAGAIAWWTFDPRPLGPAVATDPARALTEAGLRALLAQVIPVESPPPLNLPTFLTPGVIRSSPYRLCLLQFEAQPERRAGADQPVYLSRFTAVLELRTPPPHDRFVEALRDSLVPGLTEQPLDLPGDLKAISASAPTTPTAAEVSWCSAPDAFLIGFGRGSLDQWLRASPGPNDTEAALARSRIASRREGATPLAEGFVDLNALRHSAPDQFGAGRIGRLVHAWYIANARMAMISAALEPAAADRPRLVAVDLALSWRSERPGTVHTMPLTETTWPAELMDPVAPAQYAAVARSDWPNWIALAVGTREACSPDPERLVAERERWMRKHGKTLERLTAAAGPWVVVRGGPEGLSAWTAFATPQRQRAEADLRDVFGDLSREIGHDERTGVWSLTLTEEQADAERMLRRFFWGLSRSGSLVGGWGATAVEAELPAGR